VNPGGSVRLHPPINPSGFSVASAMGFPASLSVLLGTRLVTPRLRIPLTKTVGAATLFST
jgi:hypothetical protein